MLRHAKSLWEDDVIDHQRPLKKRGENDAKLMSEYLCKTIEAPNRMYVSDAVRTMATARYFKEAFNIEEKKIERTHKLYDFRGHNVMRLIKSIPNSLSTVMIVGHNHAFTSIANMLGSTHINAIPTCGFVQLEFNEQKWENLIMGTTVKAIFPRHLKKNDKK